jgi:hypothetical protein
MRNAKVRATCRIRIRNAEGKMFDAMVDIRYQTLQVQPPIGKQKRYPSLTLTVIHAQERRKPTGRAMVDWKLITNLAIRSRKDALKMLTWYAMRWKIETFHKILKSGCKAEASKLRAAERIVNLIAVFCILSWRIFWMTMMNRVAPMASPTLALMALDMQVLDLLIHDTVSGRRRRTITSYLTKIARLGGYLARAKDPPPGNAVMWRGVSRLTDIELGFVMGAQLVGN